MLSIDDKESIKKEQRDSILIYFKSQQLELFNLLYIFSKKILMNIYLLVINNY